MKRISIVILNWNGLHFLQEFLPILTNHTVMEGAGIVVADNASEDGSLAYLEKVHPTVRLIRLDKNYGFAGGYRKALREIDAGYYLLLNSDIEVTPGWLEPLVAHMDAHKDCGACMPRIRDIKNRSLFEYAGAAGGYMDRFGYAFCRGRLFDHLEEDRGQYMQTVPVFWASGACMLLRAEAYRKAGELDEAFFAHMEEIDLCWRMQHEGYGISVVPDSLVYHVGGGTLSRGNPMKTFLNFRNNLLLLYKNLPRRGKGWIIFRRMVLDGISALRFLFQGAFKDFAAVIRAHRAYYGMKKRYAGTKYSNKTDQNDVLVQGIYPGSIVADFFLRGKRAFGDLNWKPGTIIDKEGA